MKRVIRASVKDAKYSEECINELRKLSESIDRVKRVCDGLLEDYQGGTSAEQATLRKVSELLEKADVACLDFLK